MFIVSAIGQHFLKNPMYANQNSDKKFIFLLFDRWSLHLSTSEAVYIKSYKQIYTAKKSLLTT